MAPARAWLGAPRRPPPLATLGEARLKLRESLRDPGDWRELAEQLLAAAANVDGDLLIVLDEFPTMVDSFFARDPALAVQFLRWFQAQRQRLGAVRFLLGGSVNIEPLLEQLGHSVLLNDLQRHAVQPFATELAVRFVKEVLEHEQVAFERDVPEVVVRTVGSGVPFFLQVLVSELLEEPRITADRVKAAYRERVLGPANRARFAHYATRLKAYGQDEEPARRVLAEVVSGPLTLAKLEDTTGEQRATLERVLVRLEGDYYLERDHERWGFQNALMRDWWLRNASLPERS
ncbi:MAG: hypothetical protein H6735_26905 [Alphaproteobacteria bacterium]|nr:hypothetical protein [Alphaproteobacteria bacterium]